MDVDVLDRDLLLALAPVPVQGLKKSRVGPGELVGLGEVLPSPLKAVATARKLAVVIWHLLVKGESYVWARPSLLAKKLRDLELKAGHKAARGQKGVAHAYNVKSHRDEERRWVEQAETAYARFVAGWNPRGLKRVRTGAANEERR